jgi:hypothetical protein
LSAASENRIKFIFSANLHVKAAKKLKSGKNYWYRIDDGGAATGYYNMYLYKTKSAYNKKKPFLKMPLGAWR